MSNTDIVIKELLKLIKQKDTNIDVQIKAIECIENLILKQQVIVPPPSAGANMPSIHRTQSQSQNLQAQVKGPTLLSELTEKLKLKNKDT
jgi:hypothetical protein